MTTWGTCLPYGRQGGVRSTLLYSGFEESTDVGLPLAWPHCCQVVNTDGHTILTSNAPMHTEHILNVYCLCLQAANHLEAIRRSNQNYKSIPWRFAYLLEPLPEGDCVSAPIFANMAPDVSIASTNIARQAKAKREARALRAPRGPSGAEYLLLRGSARKLSTTMPESVRDIQKSQNV